MKKYADAVIRSKKIMSVSENGFGTSMLISLGFALISFFLYFLNDWFIVSNLLDMVAFSFLLCFFVALVVATAFSVVRQFSEMQFEKDVDNYKKARKVLFKRNMAVANSFFKEHRKVV